MCESKKAENREMGILVDTVCGVTVRVMFVGSVSVCVCERERIGERGTSGI